MAIANLHETLLMHMMRKAQLQDEIGRLTDDKRLAALEQSDIQSLQNASKSELRRKFKELYEHSPELQEKYKDYTEIEDFEEEWEELQAKFQAQLEEIANKETRIDDQITTDSTELEEIKAFDEFYRQALSSNIQEDFNYGLNG